MRKVLQTDRSELGGFAVIPHGGVRTTKD